MNLFSFCISFIATYLFFSGKYLIFPIGLVLLWAIGLIVRKKYSKLTKKTIHQTLIFATVFFALGVSLAYTRSHQYVLVQNSLQSNNSTIKQVSTNSAIIEIRHNNKHSLWRIGTSKIKARLHRYDKLQGDLACIPYQKDNLFQVFEKLKHISGFCNIKHLKIIENESFYTNIRSSMNSYLEQKNSSLKNKSLANAILKANTLELNIWDLSNFRKMGIAHLFAASGLHLGLIFFFIFLPFRLLKKEKLGLLLALGATFLFTFFLDFRVSLVRAFIFAFFFVFLKFLNRKTHPLNILFLAAVVIELIFPFSTFTIGYIFSFSVTMSIILFYKPVSLLFVGLYQPIKNNLSISLTATAASSITSLIFFQYFSITSILYNFLLVPLASSFLFLLLLSLILPFSIAPIIDFIASLFYSMADLQSSINFFPNTNFSSWYIYTFSLALIFLLIALWLFSYCKVSGYIKKYRKYVIIGIVLLWFPVYLFKLPITSNKSLIQVYPFGVNMYTNKSIYLAGNKAKFITKLNYQKFLSKASSNIIKKIYINANITIEKRILPPRLEPNILKKSKHKGLITLGEKKEYCFIFTSQIQPEYWPTNIFSKCGSMFLALSKDQRKNQAPWIQLIKLYNYRKKITILKYFQIVKYTNVTK